MNQPLSLRLAWIVTISAFLLIAIAFGIRSSFGLMMFDFTAQTGESIAAISFAFSLQNLLWGAFQPFFGALADRKGATFTAALGALFYASGLLLMWFSSNYGLFTLGTALLIGMAQSALGFPVLLGAVSRLAPDDKRSLMVGVVSAGASFGQLVFIKLTADLLIPALGTIDVLIIFALLSFLAAFVALGLMPERQSRNIKPAQPDQQAFYPEDSMTLMSTLSMAMASRGYILIVLGFFVCGFQVGFISLHLPQFAVLCGLAPTNGADTLAIIGAFNILGTILAGRLGKSRAARIPLAAIYLLRTIATFIFLSLPFTPLSFQLFGVSMGLLWLSTVPLTSELVVRLFGPKYAGMLFGLAFFSHQIGSFLGISLAGYFLDTSGNYDVVWDISMLLGIFAFLVHLPISEKRVRQKVSES